MQTAKPAYAKAAQRLRTLGERKPLIPSLSLDTWVLVFTIHCMIGIKSVEGCRLKLHSFSRTWCEEKHQTLCLREGATQGSANLSKAFSAARCVLCSFATKRCTSDPLSVKMAVTSLRKAS